MRYVIFAVLAAATVASAGEIDELADAEQKCLSAIAAASAKLIATDKRLIQIHRQLKKHQQFVYLKVRERASAIAGLEKSDPAEYHRRLATIRLKIIAEDPDVQDRIKEIHRLQGTIERLLGKNPAIQAERRQLERLRLRLHALRR